MRSSNRDFAFELEERTKIFALNLFRLSSSLPTTIEYNVYRNQITKSGTSIGANYREANSSRSQADFRNKIKICRGEAHETAFWLEILCEVADQKYSDQLNELYKECKEFVALFTAISNTISKRQIKSNG